MPTTDLDQFLPDLIVEVTTVCDRACPGCYSPTLRSTESPESLFLAHPDLYLTRGRLAEALGRLGEADLSISLRGGEPSRHPELDELVLAALPHAKTIYLETHARWILDDSDRTERWLAVFRKHGTMVKISFDRMHALAPTHLLQAIARLDARDVPWLIAITEPDEESFERTRSRCPFVPNDRIVFQHKVCDHRLLVQPRLGTIGVTGERRGHLTVKDSFRCQQARGKEASVPS